MTGCYCTSFSYHAPSGVAHVWCSDSIFTIFHLFMLFSMGVCFSAINDSYVGDLCTIYISFFQSQSPANNIYMLSPVRDKSALKAKLFIRACQAVFHKKKCDSSIAGRNNQDLNRYAGYNNHFSLGNVKMY